MRIHFLSYLAVVASIILFTDANGQVVVTGNLSGNVDKPITQLGHFTNSGTTFTGEFQTAVTTTYNGGWKAGIKTAVAWPIGFGVGPAEARAKVTVNRQGEFFGPAVPDPIPTQVTVNGKLHGTVSIQGDEDSYHDGAAVVAGQTVAFGTQDLFYVGDGIYNVNFPYSVTVPVSPQGTFPIDFWFESESVADAGIVIGDLSTTMEITSITLPNGATPESEGWLLTFDDGIPSPNFSTVRVINDPSFFSNATLVDFDSELSDSIEELPALGVTINSLDMTANPFISNVGGPGVGQLTSKAFGNTRNGYFAVIDPGFEGSAARNFEIVFGKPVHAAGYTVQGWGASNHQLSAYDTIGNLLGRFSFSQALIANDAGFNGFIGIDAQGFLISRLEFTQAIGSSDYIAFDNLTFQVAQMPGDYNQNGIVDTADYTVWRDNLGTNFDLNGNGDETGGSAGVVDAADYDYWKAHFGDTAGAGALSDATVPEPSNFVLAALASVAIIARKRRHI